MILIQGLPLPPSVNAYLSIFRGRLIKTREHREFHAKCKQWAFQNHFQLSQIKTELNGLKEKAESKKIPFALRIDCYFAFEKSRIFTQKDTAKQLDSNNRIKPALDGLVSILGIDDRYFFAGDYEKVYVSDKDQESTLVKITAVAPRSYSQVMDQIARDENIPDF